MFSCTCLIPFYNEGKTLLETVKIASEVAGFDHIIAVDDGSTEPRTGEVVAQIKREFPQVEIIRQKKNSGKAAAVKKGLTAIDTEWVLLLDADLKKLFAAELEKAVALTKKHADKLDLLILRRAPYNPFVTSIRHDILMSGERILRADDLRKVYKDLSFTGYQLEIAINHYFQQHQKRSFWLQTSIENTYKIHKWELGESLESFREEVTGFVNYDGWKTYWKQTAQFCRDSIETLE